MRLYHIKIIVIFCITTINTYAVPLISGASDCTYICVCTTIIFLIIYLKTVYMFRIKTWLAVTPVGNGGDLFLTARWRTIDKNIYFLLCCSSTL